MNLHCALKPKCLHNNVPVLSASPALPNLCLGTKMSLLDRILHHTHQHLASQDVVPKWQQLRQHVEQIGTWTRLPRFEEKKKIYNSCLDLNKHFLRVAAKIVNWTNILKRNIFDVSTVKLNGMFFNSLTVKRKMKEKEKTF